MLAQRQGGTALCRRNSYRCDKPGQIRGEENPQPGGQIRYQHQRVGILSQSAVTESGGSGGVYQTPSGVDQSSRVVAGSGGQHFYRPRLDPQRGRQLAPVQTGMARIDQICRGTRHQGGDRELSDVFHQGRMAGGQEPGPYAGDLAPYVRGDSVGLFRPELRSFTPGLATDRLSGCAARVQGKDLSCACQGLPRGSAPSQPGGHFSLSVGISHPQTAGVGRCRLGPVHLRAGRRWIRRSSLCRSGGSCL
ncbi:MAG: hypothetical protein BWY83_02696 [bacterium ADurb.Bin478]|nr:MAG: hypothetical protein BWY83_02696 [bacterium ADurb.Bin478]